MEVKQVICVRKDLNMRKGKMVAQGSHASMKFLTNRIKGSDVKFTLKKVEKEWLDTGMTKICLGVESEAQLLDLQTIARSIGLEANLIIDAGHTEFNGVPTITSLAIGPDQSHLIDRVTGDLKLL